MYPGRPPQLMFFLGRDICEDGEHPRAAMVWRHVVCNQCFIYPWVPRTWRNPGKTLMFLPENPSK